MTSSPESFNPFPGLRPFESHEHHLFFGRDGQSDELLRRLRGSRFLTIVGTSGSGKSSLLRAGMLPALHRGFMPGAGSRWHLALMRPGADPIANLACALAQTGLWPNKGDMAAYQQTILHATLSRSTLGLLEAARQAPLPEKENLLVVVDQFEELFRFKQEAQKTGSSHEAAHFVQLLLEATRQRELRIYAVLTMRSDFLGDCAQFRDLPEAINDGQYLIPRMTREQRRAAITGPVGVAHGEIANRLLNRLLNDVGDNPDQLPMLQHALRRSWDYWQAHRRNGEPLDLHHYESIGGMHAALSKHADEAYNSLPDERSRDVAERLFKCLTEKGPDNREIRRPARLDEICAVTEAEKDEVITIIERFRQPGSTFLMPPAGEALQGETLIDISHESLIRNWQRLKAWVDEETRSAATYRRLAETAVLHDEGRAGLWNDPDLQEALDWRQTERPNPAWARRYHPQFESAMSFLDKSAARRRRQRLQQVTIWIAVFLAAAGLLFWQLWGRDTFEQAKLRQPLQQLQHGRLSVAEFEKSLERAYEKVRDRRRLDGIRQGFLAVLLDSIAVAARRDLNHQRADGYVRALLKHLPLADGLRQMRLRQIEQEYRRLVEQPGIGLTPAIRDTAQLWLDLARIAFDPSAEIDTLLADLRRREMLLQALRIKVPADYRFLVGHAPQRDIRLKFILEPSDSLVGATVFMDGQEMSMQNMAGRPHHVAFKTFSGSKPFADSTRLAIRFRTLSAAGVEASRVDTLLLKKLRHIGEKESLSFGAAMRMLIDFDFADRFLNPQGKGFTRRFALSDDRFQRKGDVVLDRATGLMWQRSGSEKPVKFEGVTAYLTSINAGSGFAGYQDWRLPTLDEAMSLMEPQKNAKGFFIDSVFAIKASIWTADALVAKDLHFRHAWAVPYVDGISFPFIIAYNYFVRAVRSGQ